MDFLIFGTGLIDSFGYLGVFLVSLIFSLGLTMPLPLSTVIIFAGAIMNPLIVALFAGVGSALGESISFVLGASGNKILKKKIKFLPKIKRNLEKNKYLLPFFAMLPLPSMVLGLSAGVIKYNKYMFVISVLFGRIVKMLIYAFIGYFGRNLVF
ncbi:VTT domain-containing protein [Candidatus Pacearchaeota archaeon]|nr:VTT domain-containing protein [Candidatus Pacearchaeota archaeon]